MRSLCCYSPFFALCLLGATVVVSAEEFWIERKGSLTHVRNGDPSKLKVREWHIRLYRTGQPTGGRDSWGLMRGDSASEVMAELKRCQENELSGNEALGKGRVQNSPQTFFNPLGPIAVLESPRGRQGDEMERWRMEETQSVLSRRFDQFLALWKRARELQTLAKNVRGILYPKEYGNPYAGVGTALREYADVLRNASQQTASLWKKLDSGASLNMERLDALLSQFDTAETNIQTALQRWQRALDAAKEKNQANLSDEPLSVRETQSKLQSALGSFYKRTFEDRDGNATTEFNEVGGIGGQAIRYDFSHPEKITFYHRTEDGISERLYPIRDIEEDTIQFQLGVNISRHRPVLTFFMRIPSGRTNDYFELPFGTGSAQGDKYAKLLAAYIRGVKHPVVPAPAPSVDPDAKSELKRAVTQVERQMQVLPKATESVSNLSQAPQGIQVQYLRQMKALEGKNLSAYYQTLAPDYFYKEANGQILPLSKWKKRKASSYASEVKRVILRIASVERQESEIVIMAVRTLSPNQPSETIKETWINSEGAPRLQSTEVLAGGGVTNPDNPSPPNIKTKINPKDGAVMAWLPAGSFMMGGDGQYDGKPIHKVTISKGFWMYQNVVTVAQYRKFCSATGKQMPEAPSWGWKDNHPIVNVDWNEAKAYCEWAGGQLPTEAQWEYAARGGLQGKAYPWGDEWDVKQCANSVSKILSSTMPVGSYPANGYGLHDMAGNVWQWCADWYGDYPSGEQTAPTGAATGSRRVLRGGAWNKHWPDNFRAAYRSYFNPELGYGVRGFRVAFGLQ